MDVKEAIEARRAYRALEPVDITEEAMLELARAVQLAPSCFNNQPWRYVFIHDDDQLLRARDFIKQGNEWTHNASLIIVAFSKPEDDCVIRERIYHQFDLGMATAFLILRATELGLVAHPIAGFSPSGARRLLEIPEEYTVLTCILVGKHKEDGVVPEMSEKQLETEKTRPVRRDVSDIVHFNLYGGD